MKHCWETEESKQVLEDYYGKESVENPSKMEALEEETKKLQDKLEKLFREEQKQKELEAFFKAAPEGCTHFHALYEEYYYVDTELDAIFYYKQPQNGNAIAGGTVVGASAGDWLELPVTVKQFEESPYVREIHK